MGMILIWIFEIAHIFIKSMLQEKYNETWHNDGHGTQHNLAHNVKKEVNPTPLPMSNPCMHLPYMFVKEDNKISQCLVTSPLEISLVVN